MTTKFIWNVYYLCMVGWWECRHCLSLPPLPCYCRCCYVHRLPPGNLYPYKFWPSFCAKIPAGKIVGVHFIVTMIQSKMTKKTTSNENRRWYCVLMHTVDIDTKNVCPNKLNRNSAKPMNKIWKDRQRERKKGTSNERIEPKTNGQMTTTTTACVYVLMKTTSK